jgi:hypothetical protein
MLKLCSTSGLKQGDRALRDRASYHDEWGSNSGFVFLFDRLQLSNIALRDKFSLIN